MNIYDRTDKRFRALFSLTTPQITEAEIDALVERYREGDEDAQKAGNKVHQVKRLIERRVTFMTPEAQSVLDAVNIYVPDSTLNIAFAEPPDLVVVGNGLVNIVTACGYWGNWWHCLPEELDHVKPYADFPSLSVRDGMLFFLYGLMFRHYVDPEKCPLPNVRELSEVSAENDGLVKSSIAGSLLYMIMHEVGHIQLKHHDFEGEGNVEKLDLSVPENLSRYQYQEMEADNYAMDSLQENLRPLHEPWIEMALNFFIQREALLSERSETHPINLNRVNYASARCGHQFMDPKEYMDHMEKMGEGFINIERNHERLKGENKKPILLSLEREKLLSLLKQSEKYLTKFGLSVKPAIEEALPDWTELLLDDA